MHRVRTIVTAILNALALVAVLDYIENRRTKAKKRAQIKHEIDAHYSAMDVILDNIRDGKYESWPSKEMWYDYETEKTSQLRHR